HIPNHLLESYKDPALVDRFIHDLRRNALLTYETSEVKGRETMNEGISSFSLHRSTQAISLAFLLSLLSEEEKIKFMNSMLSSIQSFHGKYLKTKCVYILPLVPHLEALLKNLKSLKLPASLEEQYRENLLLLIGSSHYCCADNLHLAKEYFTQILNKNSHLEGKFYAEMLSDLALSCVDLGDLDEALEYCQKGLSLCKKIPNSTLLTAEILKTMGAAYSDKNDLPKAQSYFEAALKMIASINSKEKKELESEIYEHLASLYSKTYINTPEAHQAVEYAI
ncbi:MAG TPA: hypothetical protein DEP85_02420, partial [Holosporales bacterium]|nr:hypothetical protein [Holosporales bacterium]